MSNLYGQKLVPLVFLQHVLTIEVNQRHIM